MNDLWHEIRERAAKQPAATAISVPDDSISISYSQLVERVDRLVEFVTVLPGGPIGLLADNGPDWIISDLACIAGQRCLIPLPTFFTSQQREHALDDAGADYLVAAVDTTLPDNYRLVDVLPGAATLGLWEISNERASSETSVLPADTRKITYTSGSTGTPKGVCLSEVHLTAVAVGVLAATREIAVKRHLCVLPLATLLENVAGIYAALLRGAEISVPPLSTLGFRGSSGFKASQFLQTIQETRPSSLILVPQLLDCLVQSIESGWHPPTSLQFIAAGGGKVSRSLLDRAAESGLPVFQGYGLSECGSVISLNLPGANRPGTVGRPLSHATVSIIDGEIHIGEPLFLGYTGQREARQGALLPTGDLGYFDDEGFLIVSGRKKNQIISSFGRNVSPEWIEAELTAIPGVRQAFVAGDGKPCLVALLDTGQQIDDESLHSAVKAVNATLPDYAQIRHWCRVPIGFSVASGTLTDNGRIRRNRIAVVYKQFLAQLYGRVDATTGAGTHGLNGKKVWRESL